VREESEEESDKGEKEESDKGEEEESEAGAAVKVE
jgi:hypothetical protein